MADVQINDVPDDVLAVVDANARRAQLSREEYLRRVLARERPLGQMVTLESFRRLAETYADAKDPEIMAGAWR